MIPLWIDRTEVIESIMDTARIFYYARMCMVEKDSEYGRSYTMARAARFIKDGEPWSEPIPVWHASQKIEVL